VVNAVLIVVLCGVPAVAVILAAAPVRFVIEKFAGEATPETVAVTVYEPAAPLAVKTAAVATPDAFVVAVFAPPANVPLGPLPGAANVTVTPLTGLLPESVTVTCNWTAKALLIVAFCGVPALSTMLAGGLPKFVREKLAGEATPETVAVIVYEPAAPLAVKIAAVATPDAFVVAVFAPPANAPLGPLPGAVNVTVTPLTGLPPESFTVAWS